MNEAMALRDLGCFEDATEVSSCLLYDSFLSVYVHLGLAKIPLNKNIKHNIQFEQWGFGVLGFWGFGV